MCDKVNRSSGHKGLAALSMSKLTCPTLDTLNTKQRYCSTHALYNAIIYNHLRCSCYEFLSTQFARQIGNISHIGTSELRCNYSRPPSTRTSRKPEQSSN